MPPPAPLPRPADEEDADAETQAQYLNQLRRVDAACSAAAAKALNTFLHAMLRWDKSNNDGAFTPPVAQAWPEVADEYLAAIQHPMSLQDMQAKLAAGAYAFGTLPGGDGDGGGGEGAAPAPQLRYDARSWELVMADIELIGANCVAFNKGDGEWVKAAAAFRAHAERHVENLRNAGEAPGAKPARRRR
jgi:hypothetical protein